MGLSYNPSSFATNKTILQAIEELKKYLTQNPLACIYKLDANAIFGGIPQSTFDISDVVNPNSQELKLGDIVLSKDGYYSFIATLGETTFTIDEWLSVGARITSITQSSYPVGYKTVPDDATILHIYSPVEDYPRRYHRVIEERIIFTYEDGGNTQTAQVSLFTGVINAIWYKVESDNSITMSADISKDDLTSEIVSFSIPAGQTGADGTDGISVVGATIDASNHLILTLSDGNTIDAGALPVASGFSNYVEINTTSGTFTDDEYAKLGFNDSVIVYDNGTYKTIYKKKIETSSIIEFEAIDGASRQNLKLIDVNKGTKAFSSTGISMITSSTFDSGNATSGKVLTANGSGGTSWETAGGGGNIYEHNIRIFYNSASPSYKRCNILFTLYTNSNTQFTLATLTTFLQTNYYHVYLPATGYTEKAPNGGTYNIITSIAYWSSLVVDEFDCSTQTHTETNVQSGIQFWDTIITIL